MLLGLAAGFALAAWLAVLLLPSAAWRTRERLELPAGTGQRAGSRDLGRIAVLIPARNEADTIGRTLTALGRQGLDLRVIVVDDESADGTAAAARAAIAAPGRTLELEIVEGQPLAAGWGGKLWALSQGLERVDRDYCLLLDAEIELGPGVVAALLDKAEAEDRAMVSVMARLRCESFWERLLVPPFIFFFKLLYPFAAVARPNARAAAAAGGCALVRTDVMRAIGGFAAIRDALIDDCTLAGRIKSAGHSIWIGLSDAVRSSRAYPDLASFRRMVSRTAFTQLRYSSSLLVVVAALMLAVFVAPVVAVVAALVVLLGGSPVAGDGIAMAPGAIAAIAAIAAMAAAYWPTVRFYGLPRLWTLTLPAAGILFLAMTLESAMNYWRGTRAEWKGRTYAVRPNTGSAPDRLPNGGPDRSGL